MDVTEAADYCRQVEAYLCRKNDGHLVRIVGPAFEQVCGWARKGVPLKVAWRGIDRCLERYYAKGRRRRPVRIEYCEADVLDVFDEWRRAVGVSSYTGADRGSADHAGADRDNSTEAPARRHDTLPAHLERLVARLTALRGGGDPALGETIDAAVCEIDAARGIAKTLRGEARERLLARLRTLDASLLDAVRARCDEATLDELGRDADVELAAFRGRMPAEAYQQSRRACIDRLVRDRARLPILMFE